MDEDIPLPVDLPAAAQKIGAVSNVVGSASKWQLFKYGHHRPGKSGRQESAQLSLPRPGKAMAGLGPGRVKTPNLVFSPGVRGDRDEAFC